MRSSRANIYLQNLIGNFNYINKCSKNALICAAVKSDAYGHGAVKVAKTLKDNGCSYFGVATTLEAEELTNANINNIIIFSLVTPEEIEKIVKLNIEPVVTRKDYIELFQNEAERVNKVINVHLKVDTGMGRIGCKIEDALYLAKHITKCENLKLKGICTHFSTSDSKDQTYTNQQLDRFEKVLRELKENSIVPELTHAANSGAIENSSRSIFNMVRPGIMLYGYPYSNNIKPVMELVSKVVDLKVFPKGSPISYGRTYTTTEDEYIATLPIGYADGYFRLLSNAGEVSINSKNYPIVGNICMDQLMVKVDSSVKLYDEAILIGIKDGQPNAESIAAKINTISYEVLTNIHRVKKYYII